MHYTQSRPQSSSKYTHAWQHTTEPTPNLQPYAFSLALLISTSLRWLVEGFIKNQAVSQQFMASSIQLQGPVFLLQLWLMPCGIRQGQKERREPLHRHKEIPNLGFTSAFHIALSKVPLKQLIVSSLISVLNFRKLFCDWNFSVLIKFGRKVIISSGYNMLQGRVFKQILI